MAGRDRAVLKRLASRGESRYAGQRAKMPLGRRRPSAVSKNNSPAFAGWPQWPKIPSARYAASSAGPMPGE